ncbi:hypothetical protein HK405_015691, partial [Cladochytrium tenue]
MSSAEAEPAVAPAGVGAIKRKIILTGDDQAGVTSLMKAFVALDKREESISQANNNVVVAVSIGGGTVWLALWEKWDDLYYRLRPLLYPGTDAFILCFSVADPWALEGVEER